MIIAKSRGSGGAERLVKAGAGFSCSRLVSSADPIYGMVTAVTNSVLYTWNSLGESILIVHTHT